MENQIEAVGATVNGGSSCCEGTNCAPGFAIDGHEYKPPVFGKRADFEPHVHVTDDEEPDFEPDDVIQLTPRAKDPINPDHYKRSGMECIEAIEAMVAGWPPGTALRLGTALKYLWRHREKGNFEDLRKAIWYIEREMSA